MGRLIAYDNVVQEKLNWIVQNKTTHIGLVIGQCTEQKDIVLRLCPTPQRDEESASSGEESPKKVSKKTDDSDILDNEWLCQHAKQLLRALPGGLDILGLYVAAPSDFNAKQQAQLREILFSIFKLLGKNRKSNLCSRDRILLSICTVTSKVTCRTFDVSDFKSSATPAEWKLQSGFMKWNRVRCQLAVDLKFPIRSEDRTMSIQKQINSGLRPFFASVEEALTVVNGQQRNLDDMLDPPTSEGKKAKRKQAAEKDDKIISEWHNVELFIPLSNSEISEASVFDSMCMMTFKGAVQCRAYVHGKATVVEAIKALKQDIIRSISARCEIHCEDLLLIDEEQQDPLVVHELPRRVFAPLPQAEICVCDYQFHSDTASDSLDAFKELLSLDLNEQDIDTSCEKSPTTSTLILPDVMEDRLSEFGDAPLQASRNIYVPVLGVLAGLAVGVISYVLTFQSN